METQRLSKWLAAQGLCSRREADRYIEQGWVLVDGVRAVVGQQVRGDERIELDPRAQQAQGSLVTILYHKPLGIVSAQAEEGYTPAAAMISEESRWPRDASPLPFSRAHLAGLAVAGRLDIDSTGLLVLTQDGTIARRIIGENSEVEKEYIVRVSGPIEERALKLLNHGLALDGVTLKPARVSRLGNDELNFILKQGKKRQIRRMCKLVGLNVISLKRVRIGKVRLGPLPYGKWRYLGAGERF